MIWTDTSTRAMAAVHLVTPVDRLPRPRSAQLAACGPRSQASNQTRYQRHHEWQPPENSFHILFPVAESGACSINGYRSDGCWHLVGSDCTVECFGGTDTIRLATVSIPGSQFHLIPGAKNVPAWRNRSVPFTITDAVLKTPTTIFPSSTEQQPTPAPQPEFSLEFEQVIMT